jgi:phosphocarrier protein
VVILMSSRVTSDPSSDRVSSGEPGSFHKDGLSGTAARTKWVAEEVVVENKLGLNLSAAAQVVWMANRFKSRVELISGGVRVNAKSILGVMGLAAGKGAKLLLRCKGCDGCDALRALLELIRSKFGEPD